MFLEKILMNNVINGCNKKYMECIWYVQIQEWWENFNVSLCRCTDFNGEIIMEVAKVDNLISMEGGIFYVIQQWSRVNILFRYQILLVSTRWGQTIFMGCRKKLIFPMWCLYWRLIWVFASHCEFVYSCVQLKSFTFDHIGTSTW